MADQIALKPITTEDLQALEGEGKHYEVVNGLLKEKPMATKGHGRIEANLLILLGNFVKANALGRVYPGDTTYVVEGTKQKIIQGLMPDVSFMSAERDTDHHLDDFFYIPPDLAIEVISSSETAHEIAAKVRSYLHFGTRQVWNVYPDLRQVVIHFPDGISRTYTFEDTLTGGDVLPNFSLNVADIFN